MRLSDTLREQAVDKYRHCYLRYEALLAQLQAEGGAADGAAAPLLAALQAAAGSAADTLDAPAGAPPFQRAFLQEAQRVRLFVKSSLEQLWVALLDACAALRALGEELLQPGAGRGALPARLAALRGGCDGLAAELADLERFLRQNVAAAAQLAQMHDQRLPAHAHAAGEALAVEAVEGGYLGAAHAALLGGLALEPLLVGLSDAYELARLVESDAAALAGGAATWVPPSKFTRVTRKFWLHPADALRFKLEVARHLPLLIFGDRRKLTEGPAGEVRLLRDQAAAVSDSAEVTSVYFDNPDTLPAYHARLRKDDCASVVRLRWYGARSGAGGQRIYVERKVHREKYTGELSYKERAPIEQRHVQAYTTGTGTPPEQAAGNEQAAFLADAQRFLVEGCQRPLVRTVYRRTAFQESSNNQVRISLDSQLHMVLEHGAPRAPGDWCRDMGAPLRPRDACYFPYCVVEVKLTAEPPAWVQGLLQMGLLLPVPKFSKFLHGTALLLQPRCANVPYWFLPDERDPARMSPATWQEMADPADEYLQKGAEWLFPRERGLEEGGGGDADGAGSGATAEAAPFRPNPLRFLRRNRTAPAPCASPSSSSEDGPGAGAAARPHAVAWEDLQVAGGMPGMVHHHPGSPSAATAAAASAAAGAAAAGAVPRSCTWPVYANPLAFLPPSDPSAASLSHMAVVGVGGAGPAAAAPVACCAGGGAGGCAARGLGCPSPAHSHGSALHDSAQDVETGQAPPAPAPPSQPAGGSKRSGSKGSGSREGSGKGGGGMLPSSSAAFAALQFRLPGAPPDGAGAGSPPDAPRGGRAKALVRTRVEPKTFFANERTFLQWLQISVLIMMTATSLLSGSGLLSGVTGGGSGPAARCDPSTDKSCFASKLSGAIIAPVALLFMGYALFMYKRRTWQILRRETVRYDDQRGPAVLTVILLAVFTLSYVLAMVWSF